MPQLPTRTALPPSSLVAGSSGSNSDTSLPGLVSTSEDESDDDVTHPPHEPIRPESDGNEFARETVELEQLSPWIRTRGRPRTLMTGALIPDSDPPPPLASVTGFRVAREADRAARRAQPPPVRPRSPRRCVHRRMLAACCSLITDRSPMLLRKLQVW